MKVVKDEAKGKGKWPKKPLLPPMWQSPTWLPLTWFWRS